MKLKNYIWMTLGSMLFAACQNDTLQDELLSTDSGIYTLKGKVEGGTAMSRAQIELGGNSDTESFMWNEGDAFTIYQSSNHELKESVFRIDPSYSESGSADKKTASFSTETPALAAVNYVAFYPEGIAMNDNQFLTLELERNLDFTGVTDYNEVWSQYLKNNMYMIAEGVLEPDSENSVNFQHTTAMVRVTYTNLTDEDVDIEAIRLSGYNGIHYRFRRYYEVGDYPGWRGSVLTTYYEIATNGMKVPAGESTDFYVLFFPYNDFNEESVMEISFKRSGEYKQITLDATKIMEANNGATNFEAGKRYWFKVSERKNGLMWSKDFTTEVVTIPNPELSLALQNIYGEDVVSLNEEGHAVMGLMDVRAITRLDLSWKGFTIPSLEGIEIFENLENLSCEGVQLQTCDLTRNQNLRYVYLGSNKLTSLNVSNMTRLTDLACSYNDELSSLDLTGCTKLGYLQVQNTALTTLDIPNKERLYGLSYGGASNKLQVDLNEYPNLTDLSLMWMGLTSLNIPDALKQKLSSLYVPGNQLSSIDLSEYPQLVTFNCQDNELTSLDFSQAPQIRYLYCQGNRMASLDITPLDNLNWINCGQQKDNINLILKATDAQKEKWNNNWKHNNSNERAYLEGEEPAEVPEGNGSLDNFGNGGEF